jgi:membrane dipeptidase
MKTGQSAANVYDDAVVVDGLNVSNWESPAVFDSLHAGGVTAINATIAVWEGYADAMDNVAAWLRRFEERADTLSQVTAVQDILDAKRDGKTGVILGWQNASPIENVLDRLETFYRLGVRIIQLTYNERNLLGNGCWERTDDGLSHFGADAVREMNRLGILIDLSHVGDRTTLDAAELSDLPVACTHANARSFFGSPRNKTDDALRLIAEKGGVIGATSWPPFLRKEWESTLADFIDAIEDMVERVGIDHVGIGSDYTQGQTKEWFDVLMSQQGTKPLAKRQDYPEVPGHPEGLETPDKMPAIADALLSRGFRTDDITKILGGNWLWLLTQVWRS